MLNTQPTNRPSSINMTLSDWQKHFTTSLIHELDDELLNSIHTRSQTMAEKRFSIYKNNVFYSLSNALADLYPVVKQLVGEDFFAGTAHYYLQQHPPQQAAMVYFAYDFPEFLRQFEHTRSMSFLAPVAELELSRHIAYHAMDEESITADTMAKIAPDALANAIVHFPASMRLVASEHPIFTIWQDNQEEQPETTKTIELNEPEYVLVVRPKYEVMVFNIDEGMFSFLNHLLEKKTLGEAIESTINCVDTFEANHAIPFMLNNGLISNIIIE